MRLACLSLLALVLVGCGGRNRELVGVNPHLVPDQIAWLEGIIEADFAEAPLPSGARVLAGRFVARADGEVISSRPLMQAALRGVTAGGHLTIDEGPDATHLIKGELNTQGSQEGRSSARRYTFELQVVEIATRVIAYRQTYVISNTFEQERWK